MEGSLQEIELYKLGQSSEIEEKCHMETVDIEPVEPCIHSGCFQSIRNIWKHPL